MTKIAKVKDIMTKRVIHLKRDLPLRDAMKLLLRKKISGAPVVDPDGTLVGMLSEKDCLRMFMNGLYDGQVGGTVEDFMTRSLHSCKPTDDLFQVASLFFNHPYRRLPVMDNDKLVGIVTRSDVLDGSIKMLENEGPKKSWTDANYLTEELKAAIGSTRRQQDARPDQY